MTELRLSDRARRDLLDIYLYGIEQFGAGQAEIYRQSMESCFETLLRHPKLGRLAPAVGQGVRRHEHGSHVILYEEGSDHILVLTVLHARMRIGINL